jgi:hypothetical protein
VQGLEWRSKFTGAVDQLLSYLVWSDSKADLVLVIKSGNVTDSIGKADAAIASHSLCERRFDAAVPVGRPHLQNLARGFRRR